MGRAVACRRHRLLLLALAGVTLAGCSTLLAARSAQRRADRWATVSGTVTTAAAPRGPLVVALLAGEADTPVVVDHFTAVRPGTWLFGVEAGTYWLAAFEDRNADGTCDDEPFWQSDPEHPLVLADGQRVADVALVIPPDGRAPPAIQRLLAGLAHDNGTQLHKSLYAMSHVGTVTALSDPRFDAAIGRAATWNFYDFIVRERAGVYFLRPYDPARIPVLFVHGISGTPRDFAPVIAALDWSRYQPWVAYYPSGGRLEAIVDWLDQLFTRLEVEHGFRRAAVVAYSMGGLVARGFVLRHQSRGSTAVDTFITISSPFGGMVWAAEGVEHSPVVVRSWYGLAPDSPFLDGLFYADADRTRRRRIDDDTAHHLLFSYKGNAGDGVVPLVSQLRPEAQEEAASLRGFDETHTGMLTSPAVALHIRALLDSAGGDF